MVIVKSRQDSKLHESLLNFITTFPIMMNAIQQLINPVNETCETNSLHTVLDFISKDGTTSFT